MLQIISNRQPLIANSEHPDRVQLIRQRQVAEIIGVTTAFVGLVMQGRKRMPAKHRATLRRKLRIPVSFWDTIPDINERRLV
jgi:hypothetical protein